MLTSPELRIATQTLRDTLAQRPTRGSDLPQDVPAR
jgi:hypothetical protein